MVKELEIKKKELANGDELRNILMEVSYKE